MRFSIRDLLWATLVVAIGLAWWMSYRAVDAKRLEAVGQAHRLHKSLRKAKERLDGDPFFDERELEVLDEPLVEP